MVVPAFAHHQQVSSLSASNVSTKGSVLQDRGGEALRWKASNADRSRDPPGKGCGADGGTAAGGNGIEDGIVPTDTGNSPI